MNEQTSYEILPERQRDIIRMVISHPVPEEAAMLYATFNALEAAEKERMKEHNENTLLHIELSTLKTQIKKLKAECEGLKTGIICEITLHGAERDFYKSHGETSRAEWHNNSVKRLETILNKNYE